MKSPAPLLKEEPALDSYTEGVRRERSICWYRTKLPPGELKKLHEKSDAKAAVQTLGYLALMLAPGIAACVTIGRIPWWGTLLLVLAYGVVSSFLINAVHELVHGTVFRTKGLNRFFCRVCAFLGMINHEFFGASHVRHHRYTLHPPEDLEVTLPIRFRLKGFVWANLFHLPGLKWKLANTWRIARGRFTGEWELTLFPEDKPELRKAPVNWARFLLIGHGTVLVVGIATGQYLVPFLLTCGPKIANGLHWLCNNTQHVGLQDEVGDFRLCCRTFTTHPLVAFLYWQMNYHIEHHMYAAVPCYHLPRLHQLIRNDLPPTPHGLLATWREILEIQKRQKADPDYQYVAPLPKPDREPAAA